MEIFHVGGIQSLLLKVKRFFFFPPKDNFSDQ